MKYKFKESSKFFATYGTEQFIICGEPIHGFAAVMCTSNPNIKISRYVNTSDMEPASVSIAEIDTNAELYDMSIKCSDPCPVCKAFTMAVGDYVCWGFCYGCYKERVDGDKL